MTDLLVINLFIPGFCNVCKSWPTWFKTIWFGSDRHLPHCAWPETGDRTCSLADMQQIQNVNTEMKPNMQARTFEDSVNGKISMETQAI